MFAWYGAWCRGRRDWKSACSCCRRRSALPRSPAVARRRKKALFLHGLPAYGKFGGLIARPGLLQSGRAVSVDYGGQSLTKDRRRPTEANDGLCFFALHNPPPAGWRQTAAFAASAARFCESSDAQLPPRLPRRQPRRCAETPDPDPDRHLHGRKPAPFWIIDTHAGAGAIRWHPPRPPSSAIPRRHRPALGQEGLPPAAGDFLSGKTNPDGKLAQYPGSPWLARQQRRPPAPVRMHSTDIKLLQECFKGAGRRVTVNEGRLRRTQDPTAATAAPRAGADRPVV